MDAAAFWSQQPLGAREYASSTIILACNVVLDISNQAKDLIESEVSAFYIGLLTTDFTCFHLPIRHCWSQWLLMGQWDLKQFAAAEKNAAVLTARAGARDPSAIPSICRISAALQYPAGEIFYSLNAPEYLLSIFHILVGFCTVMSSSI